MKKYLSFLLISFVFFVGCGSTKPKTDEQIKKDQHICPQCNMPLGSSNKYTAKFIEDKNVIYFDDIGCLILWAKEHNKDISKSNALLFTTDTHKYLSPDKLYFKIDEKTPMLYGFSAYETNMDGTISFEEVRLRMLRGENMANPKIRKQILGY